jgi:hypothetical protein
VKDTFKDPFGCRSVDREKNYIVNKVMIPLIISKTSLVLMLITHLSIITSNYNKTPHHFMSTESTEQNQRIKKDQISLIINLDSCQTIF